MTQVATSLTRAGLMRAVARLGLKALFVLRVLVGMLGQVVSDNAAWPSGRRLEAAN